MEQPFVSIIMPVFNAERTIESALKSIAKQDYPQDKLEIIIADACSTDKTIEIAKKYTQLIYPNPLITGEAGKAVAVKKAQGDLIALIDSDNVLPDQNWLKKMVEPFADSEIIGSEPIEYTYRKEDNYITRYCALMGMNDPLCYFLGNYDRTNLISKKWTGQKLKSVDRGNFLELTLESNKLPTIGANGTVIRRQFLENIGDYLMDIDIIYELVERGKNKFAKVKVGIIHLFCGNMKTFYRKQKRRVKDYTYFKERGIRSYPWEKQSKFGLVKFLLCCLLVFPLFIQAAIGNSRQKDRVWWLHPVFCWITLWVYGWGFIIGVFRKEEMSRHNWSQ